MINAKFSLDKENAVKLIANILHVIYVSQIQEAQNAVLNFQIIHLVINVRLVLEVLTVVLKIKIILLVIFA